ncbi:hypothetical protein Hanom_Chr00s000348g01638241 [Helianthus anomalus]
MQPHVIPQISLFRLRAVKHTYIIQTKNRFHPSRKYLHGSIAFIDSVELDDFGVDVLEEMVKCVGYDCDMVFYFHYTIPNMSLDEGLRNLIADHDFE